MLRNRILLQLLLILLLAVVLFSGVYYATYRSYERLETESLQVNLNRIINALDHEIERLDEINWEWGRGGLVYQLISNPAAAGMRDVLIDAIAGSFNVRKIALFDGQGRLIVGREADE